MTVDVDEKLRANAKEGREQPEPEPAPIQKMESMEEWRKEIKAKYDNLKQVIEANLPQLWPALEFILSIKSIMNVKGVTLPWLGVLLGPPSSLKTAGIEALRDSPGTLYVDIFTPRSFVSNNSGVAKDKLKEIDMLPKVKDKLFLVSELSAMFTKKDDEVQETIGIFTRLADGHGLKTHTGAHGARGGEYGDVYFNMVGAAVDIPYKVHKLLAFLGPKLYFLRLNKSNKSEDELLQEMYQDEYPVKFGRVRTSLNEYLNIFSQCPEMNAEGESKLQRIPWSNKDDREASKLIARLAILLSHLRALVTTYGDTYGHGGTDYAYATASIEEPSRAATQLRNLARGNALSKGRDYIMMEDIPLIIKVALSTAPLDRVNVFDLLIANKGKLKTTLIEKSLNMAAPTARKTMVELKATELVDMPKPQASNEELEINLKEKEFKWFLTEDFAKLRQGFIPTDNTEYMKMEQKDARSLLKEKIPPPKTEDKPRPLKEKCQYCGEELEAFYMKNHNCRTGG